jgi:predicted HTH domain antitoxin
MGTRTLTTKERERLMPQKIQFEWELPDDVFGEGFQEEMFVVKVKEEAAMHLLKERRISQGKAAELLGISRHDLVDLMAHYEIPVIEMSPEELQQEFQRADAIFREKRG